jgi:hypothetical protein
MKHKQFILLKWTKLRFYRFLGLYLFIAGISLSNLQAQEMISTSGGNASGSGGSISYTMGQVAYKNNFGSSYSVTEGVQQPYEIFVIPSTSKAIDINLSVSAFPNPTNDILILNIQKIENSNLEYQLFNMLGKLIENQKITTNQTKIDMTNLVPAIYFLKVIQEPNEFNKQEVKTIKIIKH